MDYKERNYGVDLLRIVAMLFILILHVLGHGGILEESVPLSIHYELAWFLEISAYCAVNCYSLISGFVGYDSQFRYANIIYLYLQVIFYTVLVTCIFAICMPGSVGVKYFIKAIFPFAFGTYWYFTAYFGMFFLIPFMNYFIKKLSGELASKMILIIVCVFSILPTIFHNDMFNTSSGYSMLWLSLMYLVGACMRKYNLNKMISARNAALGYWICIIVTWASKLVLELLTNKIFGAPKGGNLLVSYTSPTIIGAAIMLLLCFSKINFRNAWKKIIAFFAPIAFGVYLIHEEPLIRDNFINGRFEEYLKYNPVVMVLLVLGTAFAIWLVCSLIDRIRLKLFEVLKIKQLAGNIENSLKKINFKNFYSQ
jgi:surface polysaccharide O-acyltransferase-like enzyme